MYSEQNSASGDRGRKSFAIALAIVVSLAAVLTILIRQTIEVDQFTTGTPAPKIQVAGWLNGPGPTAEELHGKVIVVDAWAFWCGPCRREAPELVKLYEKYKDRVVFIGLTGEGIEADEANREFLKQTKITWPNGYGAVQTLSELKAEFIPQRWVIDRNYKLVWNENSPESIEAAIDAALAQKP